MPNKPPPGVSGPRFREPTALTRARAAAGLTQEQAARALGVSRTSYSMVESGGRVPGVDLAQRIARLVGRSVAELWPVAVSP